MSYYTLAVYFWSSIAGIALVMAAVALLAVETKKAVACLRRSPPSSRPSFPHHSAPSHPGY